MNSQNQAVPGGAVIIKRDDFDSLIGALTAAGYKVIGPTVSDGAIIYDEIGRAEHLPIGWTDVQEPGAYSMKRRTDEALFGFAVGPHSWKKYLHAPDFAFVAGPARQRRLDDGIGGNRAAGQTRLYWRAFVRTARYRDSG